jgi:hypothetical protein
MKGVRKRIQVPIIIMIENNMDEACAMFTSMHKFIRYRIMPRYILFDNSDPDKKKKVAPSVLEEIRSITYLDNTGSMYIDYTRELTRQPILIPEKDFREDFTIQWFIDNLKSMSDTVDIKDFLMVSTKYRVQSTFDFVDARRKFPMIADSYPDVTGRLHIVPLLRYFCIHHFRKFKYFDYDPTNHAMFNERYRSGDYMIKMIREHHLPFRRIDTEHYLSIPGGWPKVKRQLQGIDPEKKIYGPYNTNELEKQLETVKLKGRLSNSLHAVLDELGMTAEPEK